MQRGLKGEQPTKENGELLQVSMQRGLKAMQFALNPVNVSLWVSMQRGLKGGDVQRGVRLAHGRLNAKRIERTLAGRWITLYLGGLNAKRIESQAQLSWDLS